MFADLDWTTPAKFASLRSHWRFAIGMTAGAVLTTVFLHCNYPNTFWFMKLWAGSTIGMAVGTAATLPWQLYVTKRRESTSGRLVLQLLISFGLFATFSSYSVVPDLASQEETLRDVRAWEAHDVISIAVERHDHSIAWINDPSVISTFVEFTQQATLFYPSHEGSVATLHLTIHFSDDRFESFSARIPARHQTDISLSFQSHFSHSELLLPNARDWLNTLNWR